MSYFSGGTAFNSVFQSSVIVLCPLLCISRGSIRTYCHYINICGGSLSPDPRNITDFLFFHCWSRGSVSVSPGEGVPSLLARKILRIGLHTLCSAFSCAVSLSQNQLEEMQMVNKKRIERITCQKRLMERLYICLFPFRIIAIDKSCCWS